MDKSKFRIYSKIGLLLVIFGFFLPISCNLNGFQIAKFYGTFGLNLYNISLYIIFLFSCLGIVLMVMLIQKKTIDIKFDWYNLIIIQLSFVIFVSMHIKGQKDTIFGFLFQLQIGAYLILIGLIISTVYLINASMEKFISTEDNEPKNIPKVFCIQCGKKIKKNGKFCAYCGFAINEIENNEYSTKETLNENVNIQNEAKIENKKVKPKFKHQLILNILSIIILIIVFYNIIENNILHIESIKSAILISIAPSIFENHKSKYYFA